MSQRRVTSVLSLILLALISLSSNAKSQEPTLLLHTPTVSADHVAFVYAGDIWVSNRDGSQPERLTVHPGMESDPYFSPDGRWIAFSGEYDGNTDVYIVPIEGGTPTRLTYYPGTDIVRGWNPDGKSVLFRSMRNSATPRYGRLFEVAIGGGMPKELVIPRAERGTYSPDASKLVYTFNRDSFWWWKRYRGGKNAYLWIFDFATHEIEEIPQAAIYNDTYPVWLGETVYFLSDRSRVMNVFSYNTATKEIKQVTTFDDYDVRSLAGSGSVLTFEQAGRVHVLDTTTGLPEALNITLTPDIPEARPHFVNVSDQIRWYEISPTGVRALFEARGDVWTVPLEEGEARNLTATSDAYERYPVWSPDGQKIAYFSDADGEYKLHIVDQFGLEAPRILSLGAIGYYFEPSWSPNGEHLLFRDNGKTLYTLEVKTGKITAIDTDSQTSDNFTPKWSPDSRWITYSKQLANDYRAIYVYDLKKGAASQITDGRSDAISPTFSRDGKYLYFAASTDFALNVSDLDMSAYDRLYNRNIYMVVLKSGEPTPFAPKSDEEQANENDEDKSKDDEVKVEIDLADIDQRILACPIEEGLYSSLQTADNGNLFYVSSDPEGDGTLMKFDLDEQEAEEFLAGASGFMISSDGKKLIYSGGGGYGIVDASGSASMGDGDISLSGMKAKIDPKAEWAQMFHEAWRLERDFFYDPNMHGVDWPKMYNKYQPFVKHVMHRSDVSFLIGELIGELTIGHAYVWGGEYPETESVDVGMLGADYTIDNNRFRFAKVYDGLNWNPDLRAPLTEPGIEVKAGDYLLAVDGKEVKGSDNLYACFQNKSEKQVTLTVNSKPEMKGARKVVVKPVSSESNLRLRAWVENNRKKVDAATNGRVAYVYLPDTGNQGYEYFNRYYYSQLDKQAVIIDERFNGGGSVADYMIDMMKRSLINWWITRDDAYYASPRAAIRGPKVMLINESAGSGGDWLPMAFRHEKLGKLIGTRTWGGLVGISAIPSLMDGGHVTVPMFGVFSDDGKWFVENEGITPDIEVRQTPKLVIEGKDPQLLKAIDVILEELEASDPVKPKIKPFPNRFEDPDVR